MSKLLNTGNMLTNNDAITTNGQSYRPVEVVRQAMLDKLNNLGLYGATTEISDDGLITVRVRGEVYTLALFDGPAVAAMDTRQPTMVDKAVEPPTTLLADASLESIRSMFPSAKVTVNRVTVDFDA